MKRLMIAATATVLLAGSAASSRADSPRAYAIIVGSNPGGPGQHSLKYAERDAASVAGVLRSLGGYAKTNIALLRRPTPQALIATIDRIGQRLRKDAAAGADTMVLFYYSGHAKAHALNLGDHELALSTLRERIMALPASLRVVILDACQSGAFSNIKGVTRAADFSFNSVRRLNATGVAVMASSAASELSQESPKLGGSYFTHHLLVALRGAGDKNDDGKVSLNEAYTYAYNRTLIATAKTAVGRQHVTLETDLKGKGDVAITYPAKASARLVLPRTLEAEVLIYRRKSRAVIAEVHKTTGTVRLALPPASYRVIVRLPKGARECDVDLSGGGPSTVQPNQCRTVVLESTASKGSDIDYDRFGVVWGMGWGNARHDAFTNTLGTFGYEQDDDPVGHAEVTISYRIHRFAAAVFTGELLELNQYTRRSDTETQRFGWNAYGLSAGIRGMFPVTSDDDGRELLVPFAELRLGVGYAETDLRVGNVVRERDNFWGYQLAASAGVHFMIFDTLGLSVKATLVTAPVIDNLFDETHDVGGTYWSIGMRKTF